MLFHLLSRFNSFGAFFFPAWNVIFALGSHLAYTQPSWSTVRYTMFDPTTFHRWWKRAYGNEVPGSDCSSRRFTGLYSYSNLSAGNKLCPCLLIQFWSRRSSLRWPWWICHDPRVINCELRWVKQRDGRELAEPGENRGQKLHFGRAKRLQMN